MASVHDCDYAQELITHSREVKCSRGQKDQLDPPVVWVMARVRNVSFDTRDGGRQKESDKGSQKNYLLYRNVDYCQEEQGERKKEWELMD